MRTLGDIIPVSPDLYSQRFVQQLPPSKMMPSSVDNYTNIGSLKIFISFRPYALNRFLSISKLAYLVSVNEPPSLLFSCFRRYHLTSSEGKKKGSTIRRGTTLLLIL